MDKGDINLDFEENFKEVYYTLKKAKEYDLEEEVITAAMLYLILGIGGEDTSIKEALQKN